MATSQAFSTLRGSLEGQLLQSHQDPQIHAVTSDSRKIEQGSLFVALVGAHFDGHQFLADAVKCGAVALVVQQGAVPGVLPQDVEIFEVADTRLALALLCARLYGPLPKKLSAHVFGVTGTNGKTTSTYLLESILQHAKHKPGVLGTINYRVGEKVWTSSSLTTPAPDLLWHYLGCMQEEDASHLLMEVSSHALDQHRVDGLTYRVAGFSNLSQDHLDYHHSMEEYLHAKARLFSELLAPNGKAILNKDDPSFETLAACSRAPVWSYSTIPGSGADLQVRQKEVSIRGIHAIVETPVGQLTINSSLLGEFNLSNLLLACGMALADGLPLAVIQRGVEQMRAVPGRMEGVSHRHDVQVVVDYAHTPDALEKVLQSLQAICRGRLLVVFGCGGDRDKGKRPMMGKVVSEYADVCIVTSDNPRTEDPQQIVDHILEGIPKDLPRLDAIPDDTQKGVWSCLDRSLAIQGAIERARTGDLVLIAGKGHETYQIINTTRYPFDDREIAKKSLEERGGRMSSQQAGYKVTAAKLAEATGGTLLQGEPSTPLQGVSTDTRTTQKGQIFAALVAARDGHTFIPTAMEKGAGALLISDDSIELPPDVPVVLVQDTERALGDMAAAWIKENRPYVVGVTGSNGKTSTKEMVAQILAQVGPTLRNEGNFNNLLGLPLTAFRLGPDHDYAVLEMGMNAPGEIDRLAEIGNPDVGIITCVAAAHLKGLGSIEGVAAAKAELFDRLDPSQTAVVNADDPHIMRHAKPLSCKKIFFTKEDPKSRDIPEGADVVTASKIESLGYEGFRFVAHVPGKDPFVVHLPIVGRHQVGNALAAIAATHVLGVQPEAIIKGLATVRPTGRRLKVVQTQSELQLLDDCYNSNPSSCRAAIDTLVDLGEGKPRFAVLGDMLEMGDTENEQHAEIGRYLAKSGIEHLFAYGPLSKHMAEAAKAADNPPQTVVHQEEDVEALWQAMEPLLTPDAWVLVKGSRGMRLERISKKLEAFEQKVTS
ncbi:MAG: UDP-N-acetylmuramoyl-L-alanyl-D-glutamate--2,6-diaminopimelate ligase [Deltaproteobacteria bacterium]|nr:UDP-N-acetylmuramoyl-L-alanyl-D-glutamate--2,6-diaminopimelate ligase [Deltaproteobacteria bacterium]|tara:strand:- start:26158 stop:29139 length:2982 start_codon:yes stop_codon:yes gene_type:complete